MKLEKQIKIVENRTSIGIGAFYKKHIFSLLYGKKENKKTLPGTIN